MYYRFYADDKSCFEGETLKDVVETISIFKAENDADTLTITEILAEYNNGREKEFCQKAIDKANNIIDELYYKEKESLAIAKRDFDFNQYKCELN